MEERDVTLKGIRFYEDRAAVTFRFLQSDGTHIDVVEDVFASPQDQKVDRIVIAARGQSRSLCLLFIHARALNLISLRSAGNMLA